MQANPAVVVLTKALRSAVVVLALAVAWPDASAFAQSSATPRGANVLPTGGGQALLDPRDSVLLLLDHQTGLFQTVKDIAVSDLRANTAMLARLASLLKIPV